MNTINKNNKINVLTKKIPRSRRDKSKRDKSKRDKSRTVKSRVPRINNGIKEMYNNDYYGT